MHIVAVTSDRLLVQNSEVLFQFVEILAEFLLLATGAKRTALVFDESSQKFVDSPSSIRSIVEITIFSCDALTKKPVVSLKCNLGSQFH